MRAIFASGIDPFLPYVRPAVLVVITGTQQRLGERSDEITSRELARGSSRSQ
jgi:hypothetical protein